MSLHETKWFIPLLTAVLAFIGILGASLVSGVYQKDIWKGQVAYEKKKTILEQRVSLLDKLSRLANAANQMKEYNDYLILQAGLVQDYAQCQKSEQANCIKPDDLITASEVSIKRVELNSEFSSTLQLIEVYFSPAILPTLSDLASQKDWWSPSVEPKFRALILEMSREIEAL